MSGYDDVDSPDYRDTNLGDPRPTAEEKENSRLRAENERLRQELGTAEYALLKHGYRKSCDIPACNCGDQWFHGGNAAERLREISSALLDVMDTNGKTLLNCVKELSERAERAEAALADAKARGDRHLQAAEHNAKRAERAEAAAGTAGVSQPAPSQKHRVEADNWPAPAAPSSPPQVALTGNSSANGLPLPAAGGDTPWTDKIWNRRRDLREHAQRLEALVHMQQEAIISDNYDSVTKKTKFQKEQKAIAAYAALKNGIERG